MLRKADWKADQYDYDLLSEVDDRDCCICLSRRSMEMILAVSRAAHWKTRYYSETEQVIDEDAIDRWASKLEGQIVAGLGNCCGDGYITRLNEDNIFQISYDGGETWTDAPELDPRNTSTRFPPLGGSGETTRCMSAENMVVVLQSFADELIAALAVNSAITGLVALILAFAATLLSGGSLGAPAFALAAAVFAVGSTALESALTVEFWDAVKCALFSHMEDDGTITNAGLDGAYAEIAGEFTGAALTFIGHTFETLGAIGMSNAGSTGSSEGDTCDTCGCEPENWIMIQFTFQAALGFDIPDGWSYENTGTLVSAGILLNEIGEYFRVVKDDGIPVRVMQTATYGETTVSTDAGVIIKTDDGPPVRQKVCTNPNGNVWNVQTGGRMSTAFRNTLCHNGIEGDATISLMQIWYCP